MTQCPSCGDLIEGGPSFLGTCQGSGACMRIERFRALAVGEPDPMGGRTQEDG